MKKNNKFRNIKFIICLTFIFQVIFESCQENQSKINVVEFKIPGIYSSKSITKVKDLIIKDSAEYKIINISYLWHSKSYNRIRTFKLINNRIYEQKILNYFESDLLDTFYVLTFIKKDTSFIFKFDFEKFQNSDRLYGYDDWFFNIKNDNNNFELKKTHMIDSTFKEIFVFDNSYKINKLMLYSGTDTVIFEKIK